MEQYISKSALVAEIERLKECNRKICAGDFDFLRKTYPEHYYSTEIYNSILSFLDTLEVIEIGVDLGDPKGDKSAEYIIDTKTLEVKEVDKEYNGKAMLHVLNKGVEQGKREMLNKTYIWLKENKDHPFIGCEDCCLSGFLTDEFIEEFRKEMEE